MFQRVVVTCAYTLLCCHLVSANLACGTSCLEIRRMRDAFPHRGENDRRAHARLIVPFSALNDVGAARVSALEPIDVPLPLLGNELALTVQLESLVFVPDDVGRIGARATAKLLSADRHIADVDIAASARAAVDPAGPVLRVTLAGEDVSQIELRPTQAARESLEAQIAPQVSSPLLRQGAVAAALRWLGRDGAEQVRERIGPHLGTLANMSLRLPALPIERARFSSHRGRRDALVIDLRTTLNANGLANAPVRDEQVLPNQLVLELGGGLVTALANDAMRQEELPSHVNSEGQLDPEGEYEVTVAWAEGTRPLKLHLWKFGDECIHAVIGAVPVVRFTDGVLDAEIQGMEYEQIDGPALVEAFSWTRALGGQTLLLPGRALDTARFEVGGAPLAITLVGAEATANGIVLAATLRDAGPAQVTTPAAPQSSETDSEVH